MRVRNTGLHGVWAAMAALSLMLVPDSGNADVNELVRETNRSVQSGDQMTMVLWMPIQFWEESMKANAAVPAQARAQVLAMLEDYTVLGVLRARVGVAGVTDAQPREELLKNLTLESNGKRIEPLALESLAPGAQLVLGQLKPVIAQVAGPVGGSMEFVVYPAKADGKVQIDASKNGTMRVKLYDQTFDWRLPLGSLLPARVDAKTGEQFPGNYNFNPFTGEKLPKAP